jgi:hypothetical protein
MSRDRFVYLRNGLTPNPSLNRTPAGGLSPARRSPVSLLR